MSESATIPSAPAPDPSRDGTYLDSGDGNFNNPANWSGGFVPTGTAIVAPNNTIQPIGFTAATTSVDHIRVSNYAPLVVPRDCTVVVGKAGLLVTNKGTAQIDGRLVGPVYLATTAEGGNAQLIGRGVILGDVRNEGQTVAPAQTYSEQYSAPGTLTILGEYRQYDGTLFIVVSPRGTNRLDVSRAGEQAGWAYLYNKTGSQVIFQQVPGSASSGAELRVPFLTTSQGLRGEFLRVMGGKVSYDGSAAYFSYLA